MLENHPKSNVVEIPDLRIENLYLSIKQTILDKGVGIPVPTVIGCLDLMKDEIKRAVLEDE